MQQLNKVSAPKSTMAKTIKMVSIIAIIVISITGGIIGVMIMDPFSPFFLLYPVGGVVLGTFVGFIIMVFLLYLSELGENIKKIAEATIKFASRNSADELKKFKELLDSGAISQAEFEIKKKQILNSKKYM